MRDDLRRFERRSDAASGRARGRLVRLSAGAARARGRRPRAGRGRVRRRRRARTAAARRRSSGSCSGSSGRRPARRFSSASRRTGSRVGARSDTWRSARRSAVTRRPRCARSSPPDVLAGGRLVGPLRREDRELVAEAIERVGLDAVADAPVRTLSGGMQQRAFIAKALAGEPSLLVLDEPTTGVDAESQESLAELLDDLHSELGVTIVYVSHEFGAVEQLRRAARARPALDRLRRLAARPSRRLARPRARPCSRVSSCASPSGRARSSEFSRRLSGSSSCNGGNRSSGTGSGTSRSRASRQGSCSTSRRS